MNQETLVTLGPDKLADMLLALRKGSPEVNLELNVVLAGAEETPDELVDLLGKEITALQNMKTLYGFNRANLIAYRMDALRRYITQNLQASSASKAMELLLTLIGTYEDIMKHANDYKGMVEDVFIEAYNDLNKLCKYVKPPAEALVDAIAQRCINATDDTYYGLLFEFKNVFQESEEVLDLIKARIEQSLKDDNNEYTLTGRIHHLKNIAKIRQDADAYIQACSIKGAPDGSDYIAIAEQLIGQQRATEALTWLKKVSDAHKRYSSYEETYILALDGAGQYEQAQEKRLILFDKNLLNEDLYKDIMAHIGPEDKASFKEETLKKVYKASRSAYCKLHFLIYSGNYHEAAAFIRHNIDTMSICAAWAFDHMALLLQEADLLATTLLYRKMIAYVLEKDDSENYGYAAKYLMMCALLSNKVKDWENFTPHQAYISTIKEGYEANEKFWSAYVAAVGELVAQIEEGSRD